MAIDWNWSSELTELWRLYNITNPVFVLFVSLQAGALDLKENLAAAGGAPWPYPAVYPYEAAFAGYPFNG